MTDDRPGEGDRHDEAALDALFAAARGPTAADLGAADRFLAANFQTVQAQTVSFQTAGPQAARRPRPGAPLRLWVSTALGVAAAVGGLMVLRPAPAELPSSAAYSVYQSALGDGW